MSFIYKITNKINGKMYIGETNRAINVRWRQHKSRAKDSQYTEYLYQAMRKYGIENFTIECLEQCCPEERFHKETDYIILYDTLAPNGYNLVLSQDGPTPLVIQQALDLWKEGFSIVTIGAKLHTDPKTISGYLKSNGVTDEEVLERRTKNAGKHSRKIVIQYSLDGDFIQEFESASTAGRELSCNNASISKCCKGNILTYNGYIWQYKDADDIEERVLLVQSKSKVGKNTKAILCLNEQKEVIKEYESASAAGRDFGVAHAGIAYAARNGGKAYGYYWKYKGENY